MAILSSWTSSFDVKKADDKSGTITRATSKDCTLEKSSALGSLIFNEGIFSRSNCFNTIADFESPGAKLSATSQVAELEDFNCDDVELDDVTSVDVLCVDGSTPVCCPSADVAASLVWFALKESSSLEAVRFTGLLRTPERSTNTDFLWCSMDDSSVRLPFFRSCTSWALLAPMKIKRLPSYMETRFAKWKTGNIS